uniref:Uncharacterized protein n=1 Tax=Pristionchus pacificus TaxID=54126 RepID=A0A2A6CQ23_PRIPA|eukprot:PDM80312.1 hypothetical protein PRIPAC_32891 [Pristionchus pacificus]
MTARANRYHSRRHRLDKRVHAQPPTDSPSGACAAGYGSTRLSTEFNPPPWPTNPCYLSEVGSDIGCESPTHNLVSDVPRKGRAVRSDWHENGNGVHVTVEKELP